MEENILLDKDKLWIVVYLNVGGIDGSDINEYVDNFHSSMRNSFDNSVIVITIPIRNGETKVDFFSVNKIPDDIQEKCQTIINDVK